MIKIGFTWFMLLTSPYGTSVVVNPANITVMAPSPPSFHADCKTMLTHSGGVFCVKETLDEIRGR